MQRQICIGVALGVISLGGQAMAQDDVLAVAWGGNSYTIDSSDGSGSLLGPSGSSGLNAMCGDGTNYYTSSSTNLLTVDPTTGVASFVATMSVNSLRGMAMQAGGPIYAYNDEGFGNPDILYEIDPSTGVATRIGSAGYASIQGLAMDANGRLWAWDIFDGLMTVNKTTGACTAVGGPGNVDIQAIAFGPDGKLYGCREALFEINTSNGNFTTIGGGGYSDVRGIEFIGGISACLTLEVNNLVGGERAQFKVSGPADGETVAIVYGLQLGQTFVNGQLGYCATFGIKGVNQSKLIGQGRISGGAYSTTKLIPGNARGLTVHFQASQRGTCPDECMSDVVTEVVR